MFRTLAREINAILNESGKTFNVYDEYSLHQTKSDEIWKEYRNIAVLYVDYGALRLLPGNKGLNGSLRLDLMLEVQPSDNVEDVISAPLEALINAQNGILNVDGTTVHYVLYYHVPTSDGHIQTTTTGIDYVTYSLPVDISLTNGLTMGDSTVVQLKLNDEWTTLTDSASVTFAYNKQLDSKTALNTNKIKSSVNAESWGLQAVANFDATNALHMAIWEALEDEPEKVWQVRYSLVGDFTVSSKYRTRECVTQNSFIVSERGQPTTLQLNITEGD